MALDAPVHEVGALVRGLFGDDTAVATADPRSPAGDLFPAERAAVAGAVEKRRREFAAGRRAARRAMAGLGIPARAVPMGPDRAPVWPRGVVGSISHTGASCAAAVARAGDVRALGIDLEPDTPLEQDLWDSICTQGELAWLETWPEAARGRLVRLIFSAKECAYKAQYPLTRTLLDFGALEIVPDPAAGAFRATFARPVPPFSTGDRLAGHLASGGGIWVTALALDR